MNGQNVEQSEFTDALLSGIGRKDISVSASAILQDVPTPLMTIKKEWCLGFALYGNGFSICKVLPVGSGNSCKKTAEQFAETINEWFKSFDVMKEALKLTLPDSVDDTSLEDWQKDVLKSARKIIEKDNQ